MSAPVIVPSRSVKFLANRVTKAQLVEVVQTDKWVKRAETANLDNQDEKVTKGRPVLQGQWATAVVKEPLVNAEIEATQENQVSQVEKDRKENLDRQPQAHVVHQEHREDKANRVERENADQKVQKENPVHQERQVNLDYKAERVLLDSPVLMATMPFVTTVSKVVLTFFCFKNYKYIRTRWATRCTWIEW